MTSEMAASARAAATSSDKGSTIIMDDGTIVVGTPASCSFSTFDFSVDEGVVEEGAGGAAQAKVSLTDSSNKQDATATRSTFHSIDCVT